MPILKDNIIGNITTATKLQTARTINGVSFDGSANINIEDRLGSAIASAATTTIGTAGLGDYMHITGTTTITSFGTASAPGVRRTLIFDGALQITHNATSLICPGAANIVTIAGTVIEVVSETTANWRVVSITHPSVSMVELGYLDGVTSNIQNQLNNEVVKDLGVRNVQGVAGQNQSCTTAQFITWLNSIGAFNYRQSKFICSWDYAGNNPISDVLGAVLTTAGCIIELSTQDKNNTGPYTITVTSPNTSNSSIPGGGIHIYNNNGSGYAPGWRRVYTDKLNGTATNMSGDLDSTGRNLILSQKLTARGTGNDYYLGGVEVLGNGSGNTIFPTIGFHQPSLYASSLQLRGAGDFRFYTQAGAGYANVTANTFIGNLSGNAATATIAANASQLIGKNWYWSGQGGQPAWLWGGSDGSNMYVYNPSNFSVNYANTAGTVNRTLVASGIYNPGTIGTGDAWLWFNTGFDCGSTYKTEAPLGKYQLDLGIEGGYASAYQYRIGIYHQLGISAGYSSGTASDGGYPEGGIVVMLYIKPLNGAGGVTGGIRWKLYRI